MLQNNPTTPRGFALLLTLIVVTVVVSVSITLLELTRQQLAFTLAARDSEVAFHAANAGMECLRYTQQVAATDFANGSRVDLECLDTVRDLVTSGNGGVTLTGGNGGNVYYYENNGTHGGITWNGDRCSMMQVLVIDAEEADANVTARRADIQTLFPGYIRMTNKSCPAGAICTIAQVTGYNKACAANMNDSVRREILLEF